MIIRKAAKKDIEKIMKMYKSCISAMLEIGIDQWDVSYPNVEIITSDINAKTFYIAEINAQIIGGINIDQNQDKAYLDINWQDISNSFLVVHRLAVRKEFWNKSIGKRLMLFAEKLTIEKGLRSVRLDTYSGNPKAMQFYIKLGYKQLGKIDLKANKDKYHCFEKIIH
jgi:GNAT superfamily N-acetyltransferase